MRVGGITSRLCFSDGPRADHHHVPGQFGDTAAGRNDQAAGRSNKKPSGEAISMSGRFACTITRPAITRKPLTTCRKACQNSISCGKLTRTPRIPPTARGGSFTSTLPDRSSGARATPPAANGLDGCQRRPATVAARPARAAWCSGSSLGDSSGVSDSQPAQNPSTSASGSNPNNQGPGSSAARQFREPADNTES